MPPLDPVVLDAGPQGGSLVNAASLLERGATATARNPLGFPAIVLAASFGGAALPAVAALAAHGADVNAPGPAGETALTLARRAIPIQPYFDAAFPHGRDQFISAAATNWATQALIYASTKSGTSPAPARAR